MSDVLNILARRAVAAEDERDEARAVAIELYAWLHKAQVQVIQGKGITITDSWWRDIKNKIDSWDKSKENEEQ